MSTILIYGATGYSARLILEHINCASLPGQIILAGRDESKLQQLAEKWNLHYQAFALDSASTTEHNLRNVHTILNCAGPFAKTVEPLMRAAVRTKTNYLDLSAELESYLLAEELDRQAKEAGVVLQPGCGVCMAVMTGLTAHVLKRVNKPLTVNTAIFMPGSITAGTASSAGGNQALRRLVRSNGDLVQGDSGNTRSFDFRFDSGPVRTIMFGMPDVIALWHTFKVPNITSYIYMEASSPSDGDASATAGNTIENIDGPSPEEREVKRMRAAIEVVAADGTVARSVLETVNGYTLTARTAADAVRRISDGKMNGQSGFHTSVTLFGEDYIKTFDDINITDV